MIIVGFGMEVRVRDAATTAASIRTMVIFTGYQTSSMSRNRVPRASLTVVF
jgi:hypothetical protein